MGPRPVGADQDPRCSLARDASPVTGLEFLEVDLQKREHRVTDRYVDSTTAVERGKADTPECMHMRGCGRVCARGTVCIQS